MDTQGLRIQKLRGCNIKSSNVTLQHKKGHIKKFILSSFLKCQSDKGVKNRVVKLKKKPLNSQTSEFLKVPESALHRVPLCTLPSSSPVHLSVPCSLRPEKNIIHPGV